MRFRLGAGHIQRKPSAAAPICGRVGEHAQAERAGPLGAPLPAMGEQASPGDSDSATAAETMVSLGAYVIQNKRAEEAVKPYGEQHGSTRGIPRRAKHEKSYDVGPAERARIRRSPKKRARQTQKDETAQLVTRGVAPLRWRIERHAHGVAHRCGSRCLRTFYLDVAARFVSAGMPVGLAHMAAAASLTELWKTFSPETATHVELLWECVACAPDGHHHGAEACPVCGRAPAEQASLAPIGKGEAYRGFASRSRSHLWLKKQERQ